MTLQFPIAQDCQATINLTGKPTQQAIRRLIAMLEMQLDAFPTGPTADTPPPEPAADTSAL